MDRNLDYVFSPLNSVDLKSLQRVADHLKDSRKKNEKAIGVFLSRVVAWRAGEMKTPPGPSSSSPSSSPSDKSSGKSENTSHIQRDTGLRDLY